MPLDSAYRSVLDTAFVSAINGLLTILVPRLSPMKLVVNSAASVGDHVPIRTPLLSENDCILTRAS